MAMREIPVYLFTGFLEAGKTKFIQETLEDERFNAGERTLLILCEEGEEEYRPDNFAAPNVFVEVIEDPEDMCEQLFHDLAKKHRAERAVIEYNGMWTINDLYQALPENWPVYQEVLFADATTFLNYNQNMRQLTVDKLRTCEMVVFNRFTDRMSEEEFHKIVRGVSRRAEIAYEHVDGKIVYDNIEDPLPFDIEAPVIEIADQDYALFYRDIWEESDKYAGKVVSFLARAAVSKQLPEGCFIGGRHVMTCCVEDIEFMGFAILWDGEPAIENRGWIRVKARVAMEIHPAYDDRPGPVLVPMSIVPAQAPEQEVATFY